MEIVLIRHTQPATAPDVCYGQLDVSLAPSCEADMAATLAGIPRVDFVHTSSSTRCSVLACALGVRDGCDVNRVASLQELNFGDWEGTSWSDIARADSDLWAEDPWRRAPPNGETESSMWRRIQDWYVRDLQPKAGRHAIVAHAGTLRHLRCLILGLSPDHRWAWRIECGQVATLRPIQCTDRSSAASN